MTAAVAALGSIIGYVGSEVASDISFQRLLWPERFYNDCTASSTVKLLMFTAMGGPLHRAALEILQKFERNGLYRGPLRCKMLGTAFYPSRSQKYTPKSELSDKGHEKETRNCLWIEVLNHIRSESEGGAFESEVRKESRLREIQTIYELHMRAITPKDDLTTLTKIREDQITGRVVFGIACSEFSALGVASAVSGIMKCHWLAAYFCIPLLLKLLALLVRIRRQPIDNGKVSSYSDATTHAQSLHTFQFSGLDRGFLIVKSPEVVFRQFVRHYGHPCRDGYCSLEKIQLENSTQRKQFQNADEEAQSTGNTFNPWVFRMDRMKEIVNISIIYAFVLYFPVGLLLLLWERNTTQCIWLGFQLYLILMMHIARLAGWEGSARTEERIARCLQRGDTVCLQSPNDQAVIATLKIKEVKSVKDARIAIEKLVMPTNIINLDEGEAPLSRTSSTPACADISDRRENSDIPDSS